MKENDPLNEQPNEEETPIVTETSDNLSTEETIAETEEKEVATEGEAAEKEAETEKKESKRGFFGKKNNKEEELKKKVEELDIQKKELNEKFLHLYSEFDNYKKRTNREKLELLDTASERVISQLLPVIDDFERAIKANENLEDIGVIKDGFNLIYNKLLKLLAQFNVTEIEAKGAEFDTDLHEAITHFPAPTEEDKGKVIDVTEKGYKIKDKVIRYAKVVVAQ